MLRKGPSFPPGPTVAERLRRGTFFSTDSPEFYQENARRFGDVCSFRTPNGFRQFQFNHPDTVADVLVRDAPRHLRGVVLRRARGILGDGLLTSEEPLHLRQRRLAQPAFHRDRIAGYGREIVRLCGEMTAAWAANLPPLSSFAEGGGPAVPSAATSSQPSHPERSAAESKDPEDFGTSKAAGKPFPIEAHSEMVRLTLRITSRCLLGSDVIESVQTFASSMATFNDYLPFALLPGAEYLEKLPVGPMPGMRRALAALDALIFGMIRERRASGHTGDDLLGMLMDATDEKDPMPERSENRMSDRQVRDEALTILLAGHETTANALTFCLWLVARHTGTQRAMQGVIDEVCRDAEGRARPPEAADYPRLAPLQRVFAESMRLYPPAWVVARTAREPYTMRTGEHIPKGAHLIVSPLVIHHDERWWPDPERFDPDRFLDAAKATRPKMSYLPFGGGARYCIGEGFAWTEGVLMLATVLQHWNLALPDPQQESVPLDPKFTIRPAGPVPLLVERRLTTVL